jgi:hypothetical protein
MIDLNNFLPIQRMGRGTMRSMVEGYWREGEYPSTTLRVVPLPKLRLGRK